MHLICAKKSVFFVVINNLFIHAAALDASQALQSKSLTKTKQHKESVYCSVLPCWSQKPCLEHPKKNTPVASCSVITKTRDDNDNPVPVSFVLRQNLSAINPYVLMARIVKGYIGDAPQSVMYCLGYKSHSVAEGKYGQLGLGQGYQHACAPELLLTVNKELQIKYEREMTWNKSCAATLNPGRVLAWCMHPIGLSDLVTMKTESSIDTNLGMADEYYSPGYFPLEKEPTYRSRVRGLQIDALRKIFGTVCVPSDLTGNNGHALYVNPYLITCQHDRLNTFEMHDDKVPAVEYHAKIDSFFQKLGKLEKKRLVKMYQPKHAVVRFHV